MKLGRKLKIFAVVTFIGVVLMTVSFVSPGWVNLTVQEKQTDVIEFFQSPSEHKEEVHMSAGLWYFIVCFYNCKIRYMSHASPFEMPEDGSIEPDDRRIVDDSWMITDEREKSKRKKCHVTTYFCNREAPFMDSFPNTVYREVKGNFVFLLLFCHFQTSPSLDKLYCITVFF
jgi:hypothetical protein